MPPLFFPSLLSLLIASDSGLAQGQSQLVVESPPVPATQPALARLPPPSARPRMPYRIRDQCPFEYGCDFGIWQACETLPLWAAPDFEARPIYSLAPLERFRALRADMIVTRAGRARVVYAMDADAAQGWPSFPIDTDIDVLDYAGEGRFRIWAAGRLWGGEGFWSRDPTPRRPARLLQAPRMTWWVEVETLGGQRGWLGLRNIVEDAMGIDFDEALDMGSGPESVDDRDCAEILRYHGGG